MRSRLIVFLKSHPLILRMFWKIAKTMLEFWGLFIPLQSQTMIFCSFGGRKFDDSPKAIYDEVCRREQFRDWKLIWAFAEPDKFEIPRGEKIKIDTLDFFKALLYSRVWVSNSGMDRGIEMHRKKNLIVETWHGTPLKKICGDENQNALGGVNNAYRGKTDNTTIRCAQSEFDRQIFERVFHAERNTILLSDLPRNDSLLRYRKEEVYDIKRSLGISNDKTVILYTPTYREYRSYDAQPVMPLDFKKWREKLGEQYVLLIRAHYAVSAQFNITYDDFVIDVSEYPSLNDLYIIADMMISDYSSTYFDYAILDRPMLCFAYDLAEYSEKRGLYLDLEEALPCPVDRTEDEVIAHILEMDMQSASKASKSFHERFAPYAGNASRVVVNEIEKRLAEG